ncbi:hypothetical protein [Sphingobium boeckii]|uniref:Uncharacterized protein n=1 Tax=Sphingobium boeckii TaxID=1082345 RepID=A0A7W9AGF8_9SPHN|nr:hypothetical protein [Sphingobium boeckii]MBB5685006.1 hypothetical protein [Sphingobium boeckii]
MSALKNMDPAAHAATAGLVSEERDADGLLQYCPRMTDRVSADPTLDNQFRHPEDGEGTDLRAVPDCKARAEALEWWIATTVVGGAWIFGILCGIATLFR